MKKNEGDRENECNVSKYMKERWRTRTRVGGEAEGYLKCFDFRLKPFSVTSQNLSFDYTVCLNVRWWSQ